MAWPIALVLMVWNLSTAKPVTIAVLPTALMAGGSVRVTCRVPRSPANQGLTVALLDYRSSYFQLNGNDHDRVTFEITFDRVPCEAELAVCELITTDGVRRAVQSITVADCH